MEGSFGVKNRIIFIKFITNIFNYLFLLMILMLKNNRKKQSFQASLKSPKVSIFLPIYNKEDYLLQSIGSIQNQTLKNIEIVAINDGSTDNSLKVLKKISKNDKRIKIINNDRNHGLLYSRAMGVINSQGEYLMNLDPDDKLISNNNLEILYNEAVNSNLDFIHFLIKRMPRDKEDNKVCLETDRNQLILEDFLITNKFVKKIIFLKAFKIFYKDISGNKWNYHEDNIWNLLTHKLSKSNKVLNKSIYLYKRNNISLNILKDKFIEARNTIYRFNRIIKINLNDYNNFSYQLHYNYCKYYNYIINKYNTSILKDKEIKNSLIRIAIHLIKISNFNIRIRKYINHNIIKISDKKIIIFFNSYTINIFDFYMYYSIFKIFKEINKKILFINLNNNKLFNEIMNYTYYNDILIGLDKLLFDEKFKSIINNNSNNKIIILSENLNITLFDIFRNNKNLIIFLFNNHFIYLKNNHTFNNKFNSIPLKISDIFNYFIYKKALKNFKLNIFFNNLDGENMKIIKTIRKITSKFFDTTIYYKISKYFNKLLN